MANVHNLQNKIIRLAAKNEVLTKQLADKDRLLIEETRKSASIETELELVKKQEKWLHSTMKLRGKIEKCEALMRPTGDDAIPFEIWDKKPRSEKWNEYLPKLGEDGYSSFVSCVQSIVADPAILGKRMKVMYGVLNGRIHYYITYKEISKDYFTEADLIGIAACLDKVDL